jgi:hypothetical protein
LISILTLIDAALPASIPCSRNHEEYPELFYVLLLKKSCCKLYLARATVIFDVAEQGHTYCEMENKIIRYLNVLQPQKKQNGEQEASNCEDLLRDPFSGIKLLCQNGTTPRPAQNTFCFVGFFFIQLMFIQDQDSEV